MARDNPFDRLFGFGTVNQPWTESDIDDVLEEIEQMVDGNEPRRTYDGCRREEVNGEVTEYVLDGDEWIEIEEALADDEDEDDSDDGLLDVTETEDGYRWTVDMSRILPAGSFSAEASMNNGIVEVNFTPDE